MSDNRSMMRSALALWAVSVLCCVSLGSPAVADTPGCVSKREFNRIPVGMAQARVHRIFDTEGDVTGLGAPHVLYSYQPCRSTGGIVQISYDDALRVVGKSGYWIS